MSTESQKVGAHTSGPWVYYLQGDSTAHIVATELKDSHGRRARDIVRVVSGEANARLIAAAPELFEALREVTDSMRGIGCEPCFGSDNPAEHAMALAEAALAKADGRRS